jgi:hypothetical protein
MRLSTLLVLTVVASVLVFGACAAPAPSAAPAAFPAAGGPLQITLATNPDPAPSAGETELILEIRDANGQPQSGLVVTVTADMVGHSMGAMQGPATDQGSGRYATKVPFNMAGPWKIIVEVRQGDAFLATQDFVVPVQ